MNRPTVGLAKEDASCLTCHAVNYAQDRGTPRPIKKIYTLGFNGVHIGQCEDCLAWLESASHAAIKDS